MLINILTILQNCGLILMSIGLDFAFVPVLIPLIKQQTKETIKINIKNLFLILLPFILYYEFKLI